MQVFVCNQCGKTAPPLGTGCDCRAEVVLPATWFRGIRIRLADAADKGARLEAWRRQQEHRT